MTVQITFRFFLLSVWATAFSVIARWHYHADSNLHLVVAVISLPALFSCGSLLKTLLGNANDKRLAIGICTMSGILALWSRANGSLSLDQTVFAIVPLYQIGMFAISYRVFIQRMKRSPVTVVLDFSGGKEKGPDQLFFFATAMLIGVFPLMVLSWIRA